MLKAACEYSNGICNNCYYSDNCNRYNDIAPYDVAIAYVKNASMMLCEGRHEIPEATDGAIFGNEVNPLAIEKLENEALEKLEGLSSLDLYVTGLTVALIAALNACYMLDIDVTLYHFDKKTKKYYKQLVKHGSRTGGRRYD